MIWTQKAKSLKVCFSPVDEKVHEEAFRAHIWDITSEYKMIVLFNLLGNKLAHEDMLT